MCPMNQEVRTVENYGVEALWHDSCANCGCVANWHAFELPEGATMVAFPEKFPCKGFEFAGCPNDCTDFVFRPATATVTPTHQQWEKLKADARTNLMGEQNNG